MLRDPPIHADGVFFARLIFLFCHHHYYYYYYYYYYDYDYDYDHTIAATNTRYCIIPTTDYLLPLPPSHIILGINQTF